MLDHNGHGSLSSGSETEYKNVTCSYLYTFMARCFRIGQFIMHVPVDCVEIHLFLFLDYYTIVGRI